MCPTCGDEVVVPPRPRTPRDWDIDHVESWTNREFPPNVTRQQVLDNYQQGTRLECPSCNRGRGNRDTLR
jgi:filamentous hemagglutinin